MANEMGIRSSLSYRLFTTGRELGALNLFSRQVNAFRSDDVLEGLAIAAHAAVALSGANRLDAMARGLATRTVIGQATGILMERFNLDPDRAFDVLRRVSIQSNTKLIQIAEELVSTGKTPGTDYRH